MQCDIPKLFAERCGNSTCHGPGDSSAADLDLTSPGVEDRVSGVPGISCTGLLADPAAPEDSLLYQRVLTPPTCGEPMPIDGEALNEDELVCLRDWISGLLPPTDGGCESCICEPGVVEDCYGGPEGTADVGACTSGSHMCQTDGMGWTPCEGEVVPHGEDCFTTDIDENCDGAMPDCSETWALGFGDEQVQAMRSAVVDSAGNIHVLGDFEGVVSFGGDPLTANLSKADLVLTKHDHFGNPMSSVHWGDNSNQYGTKLIIDDDDSMVFAARIYGKVDFGFGELDSMGGGDILIVKLDSEGEPVWSRLFGDPEPDRTERLVFDAEGDVIMTGTFSDTIDFGGDKFTSEGMRDAFVVQLDGETGEHIFSRQIGGSGDDYGYGIDVDVDGTIVIAGRFQDTVELDGSLSSAGGSDIYLARLDQSGEPIWSRKFGGAGEDEVHDLKLQQNGDIVLIGGMSKTLDFGGAALVSEGKSDIFVATLDPDGNHEWSVNYGDDDDQFDSNLQTHTWLTVALGENGKIHVGGTLLGTLDFGGESLSAKGSNADVFHFTLDADGSFLGGARYGGSASDLVFDIVPTEPSHAILVGRSYSDELDFGDAGKIVNAPGGDGFIVKLPVP